MSLSPRVLQGPDIYTMTQVFCRESVPLMPNSGLCRIKVVKTEDKQYQSAVNPPRYSAPCGTVRHASQVLEEAQQFIIGPVRSALAFGASGGGTWGYKGSSRDFTTHESSSLLQKRFLPLGIPSEAAIWLHRLLYVRAPTSLIQSWRNQPNPAPALALLHVNNL